MNIGVIGWWHQDNQGDRTILENMARALSPHRLIPIDAPFDMNEDVLQRLNLLDFLILGGGGLFQYGPPPPFDTFDAWAGKLQAPIGVAGLGIDTIPPEYRPAALALAEQARFFFVRDRSSREIMNHPRVQLAPDLSFLYPLPQPLNTDAFGHGPPVCGVNLRKLPGVDVDHWIQALRALPFHLQAIPFTTFGPALEVPILRQLDQTCPGTFDLSRYDGLDLMVGMAFHSVVFAIQAAIPVIAIASAPKVRRLMVEMELERYVLGPDEWQRLPELADRLLGEHQELISSFRHTTEALASSAQGAMAAMRAEIERAHQPRTGSEPMVSVVVIGNGSDAANQTTLTSCLGQTHTNLEVLFVGDGAHLPEQGGVGSPKLVPIPSDPAEGEAECLNRAFAQASGEYLSWITAGDSYAPDAIACMVDSLEQRPACDMVFTDYYNTQDRGRLSDLHRVDPASKLFRRNVVGPSFLYRRRLAETTGRFRPDASLVAYEYWLRAHKVCALQELHVPLFYERAFGHTVESSQLQRRTRRQWRTAKPWHVQAVWRIIDTDVVENWAVRPLLAGLRRLRGALGKSSQ